MTAIRTTVVGSYPIPSWLAALPSTPNLRDAILVVLKTQELADIDVVSDGELSRFDVNHPETNGMIDYFLRPLDGFDSRLSRSDLEAAQSQPGLSFRARPAGIVRDKLGEGTLDLASAFESARNLTNKPLKFTVTSPYMLAKTVLNRHYADFRSLVMDLADILRRQVESIDAAVVQVPRVSENRFQHLWLRHRQCPLAVSRRGVSKTKCPVRGLIRSEKERKKILAPFALPTTRPG